MADEAGGWKEAVEAAIRHDGRPVVPLHSIYEAVAGSSLVTPCHLEPWRPGKQPRYQCAIRRTLSTLVVEGRVVRVGRGEYSLPYRAPDTLTATDDPVNVFGVHLIATGDPVDAFGEIQLEVMKWMAFERGLRHENRFFPNHKDYVAEILERCGPRHTILRPRDGSFFRARIMPAGARDPFPLDKMGAPPTVSARGGRLNPEGLSYLYLASDESTALAEVRPWMGAHVTIAEFQIATDLTVFDLRSGQLQQDRLVNQICHAFARPTHQEDPLSHVATQYVAEVLKQATSHAVMYDSAMADGWNIMLFFPELAHGVGTRHLEVGAVRYESSEVQSHLAQFEAALAVAAKDRPILPYERPNG